ncbi:MAG: MerR family transcriptional regulator [Actinobacteria bacterium]|nr:MerR family transcriptional regulator [Actinomycetota bacterium]
MNDASLLSISEVVQATGLKSSALRYYEKVGLLEPAARIGGRRHYHQNVLQRIAVIVLLQEVGFRIGEIADLVARDRKRGQWRGLAEAKLEEIDTHIKRVESARDLLRAAIDCGCSNLDTCGLVSERRHPKVVHRVTLQLRQPA